MSASLNQLDPALQPFARDLVLLAGQAGLQPRVTSTRRSHSEQQRLYNRFLAGAAEYPVAPPGRSAHEYGLAFDILVTPYDALADLADVWIQAGGVWHASDPIHFEYPGFSVSNVQPEFATVSASDLLGVFQGPENVDMGLLEVLGTILVKSTVSIPWEIFRALQNAKPGDLNRLLKALVDWFTRF